MDRSLCRVLQLGEHVNGDSSWPWHWGREEEYQGHATSTSTGVAALICR